MVSDPFGSGAVYFESLLRLPTGTVRRLTVAAVESLPDATFSISWSCCFVPVGVRVLLSKPEQSGLSLRHASSGAVMVDGDDVVWL